MIDSNGDCDRLSQALCDALDGWVFRIGKYIPFTGTGTLWANLQKRGDTILDVSFGRRHAMRTIKKRGGGSGDYG